MIPLRASVVKNGKNAVLCTCESSQIHHAPLLLLYNIRILIITMAVRRKGPRRRQPSNHGSNSLATAASAALLIFTLCLCAFNFDLDGKIRGRARRREKFRFCSVVGRGLRGGEAGLTGSGGAGGRRRATIPISVGASQRAWDGPAHLPGDGAPSTPGLVCGVASCRSFKLFSDFPRRKN